MSENFVGLQRHSTLTAMEPLPFRKVTQNLHVLSNKLALHKMTRIASNYIVSYQAIVILATVCHTDSTTSNIS